MNKIDNERLDLNLLNTLAVLLQEQNVTRAAERLGLTQSAVSHALGRLRALFGDELLVRAPGGMRPTARAESLRDRLEVVIRDARELIERPPEFSPSTSTRTFRLSAPDSAELVLLPPLINRLASNAPLVDLHVRALSGQSPYEPLERGDLDIAIGLFSSAPAGFMRQTLTKERFVCLVRRDHPAVGQRMTLSLYTSLSHVLVAPQGGTRGMVEPVLEQLGLERRIALVVPQFVMAPLIVAQTDLVVTVTHRVANTMAELLPLRVLKPPIELSGYDYSQMWHERYHQEPGHVWFRRQISRVARGR